MNDNTQITLRGRIGTDLELRTSQKGTQWTRFRVAVPVAYKDKQGAFVELDPRWYTVRAWGRLAASAASSLKKGDAVVVLGHPTAEAWLSKDGQVNSALTVTARAIGPDLTFTSVRVLRADKPAEKTDQNGTQTVGSQASMGSWGVPSHDYQHHRLDQESAGTTGLTDGEAHDVESRDVEGRDVEEKEPELVGASSSGGDGPF